MSILTRTPTTIIAAVAALLVFAVGVPALTASRVAPPPQAPAAAPAGAPRTPQAALARAQAAIAKDPRNGAALDALAGAALDQARATGDPSWLTTADRASRRSLRIHPRDFGA